ncbi:hypothetical protein TruAng_006207 [Truncatella angustata]|nr:hypothetical protein TruAng_006207 [Truncatella angustata]
MAQSWETRTSSFLNWFRALPGANFHPDIKIHDYRRSHAGRGIVATADIPEDTLLFTIPRDAILNTLTSDLPKRIPQIFEDSTAGLQDDDNEADEEGEITGPPDSWVSLILVMIYEFLQGDQSRWRPYFDVLPEEFDTPMFWSNQELAELQASAISSKVGKDEADNMFRAKVLPTVQEHADVFYPRGAQRLGEDRLMALAHRMGSTIMAYAFDLENEEEDPEDGEDEWMEDKEGKLMMGMVPMADILNADAAFNAHVNHEDHSLTVTSIKPIQAGQEILNYYGPLSNGDLLRRYGYVTETHSRYDVVELPWDLVSSVLKDVLKEQIKLDDTTWGKAINDLEDEEIEDVFVLDRDLDGPDEKGNVPEDRELKALPEDLVEQVMAFLRAVRKAANPNSIPDKQKAKELMLLTINRALQIRLSQYQTRAAQDLEVIARESGKLNAAADIATSRAANRTRMAAIVRWGEKDLLQQAIELSARKLSELDSLANAAEPSAKRQRR